MFDGGFFFFFGLLMLTHYGHFHHSECASHILKKSLVYQFTSQLVMLLGAPEFTSRLPNLRIIRPSLRARLRLFSKETGHSARRL